MQQCLRALKKKYQIRKSGSNGKKTSHTLSRFQQIPIKLWFTATDHQKHFSAALEKEMLVSYFDPFDNFSNWKPKLHEKCWAWLVAGREIWAKCSIVTEVYVHVNIRKISSLFICAKSWVGFKNTEQRRICRSYWSSFCWNANALQRNVTRAWAALYGGQQSHIKALFIWKKRRQRSDQRCTGGSWLEMLQEALSSQTINKRLLISTICWRKASSTGGTEPSPGRCTSTSIEQQEKTIQSKQRIARELLCANTDLLGDLPRVTQEQGSN